MVLTVQDHKSRPKSQKSLLREPQLTNSDSSAIFYACLLRSLVESMYSMSQSMERENLDGSVNSVPKIYPMITGDLNYAMVTDSYQLWPRTATARESW